MKHCIYCGHELNDDMAFCEICGKPQQAPVQQTPVQPQPQVQVQPTPVQVQPQAVQAGAQQYVYQNAQPPKKSKKFLAILIPVILLIIGGAVAAILLLGDDDKASSSSKESSASKSAGVSDSSDESEIENRDSEFPDVTYTYLSYTPTVNVNVNPIKTIYPRQYNRLDSILVVDASSVHGDTNVRISAEIPGFTQPYNQTLTLSKEVTTLYIKPALVTGDLGLSSAKNSQINFKVENLDTGKIIKEDTFSVKLMSEHDINNSDPQWGTSSIDAYMSFLTPEDECIDLVTRTAIDYLEKLTNGQLNAFAGYQYDSDDATYYQALAVQCAISSLGVKYNAGGYSNSDGTLALQNVKLPKEVISTKGGLCVETSLLVASVLMRQDMHCFLVFPPGHCQVAVESNNNSGNYFLIETTLLPVTNSNINSVVTVMDKDEWQEYITNYEGSGESCYLVDCSLASKLGFQSIN